MKEAIKARAALQAHADDYRHKAEAILKANPRWVEGEPEERSREYLDLAVYFDRLSAA